MTSVEQLPGFCRDLLASIPRSDQRRWAEIYVRGLVSVSGRKSVRRISEHVIGHRADQGLQQFVNQSPWRDDTVRRDTAHRLSAAFRPRAWVLEELVFPKNGASSVGVCRQYAPSAGRVLNCQLGLGVFLAGSAGGSPVNWRLMLPPRWDDDRELRDAAHLPDRERSRSRWEYVLDAVDEMVRDWSLTPAPIVIDARHDPVFETVLLRGLEDRGLRYLVRVSAGAAVHSDPRSPQPGTAGGVARSIGRGKGMTLGWPTVAGGGAGSLARFAVTAVAAPGRSGWPRHPSRRLLAEWAGRDQQLSAMWLTNLPAAGMPELIGLTREQQWIATDVAHLHDELGLGHFEGRSFRGWHHHVTLVSLAKAYTLSQHLADAADARSGARVTAEARTG